MELSPHEIAWLVVNIGRFTADLSGGARIAVAVALAESGGDTDALGRSKTGASIGQRDHGLWQISGRWHGAKLKVYRWRDPFDNVRMCRLVYDDARKQKPDESGWWPWAVYASGAYEQFLTDADFGLAAPFEPVNPDTTAWRR